VELNNWHILRNILQNYSASLSNLSKRCIKSLCNQREDKAINNFNKAIDNPIKLKYCGTINQDEIRNYLNKAQNIYFSIKEDKSSSTINSLNTNEATEYKNQWDSILHSIEQESNRLSHRAKNTLRQITTCKDKEKGMHLFQKTLKDPTTLRNCGVKTAQEISEFFKQIFSDNDIEAYKYHPSDQFHNITLVDGQFEWDLLRLSIESHSINISKRARNCLRQITSIEDCKKGIQLFSKAYDNPTTLQHCGLRTAQEIEIHLKAIFESGYFNNIKEFFKNLEFELISNYNQHYSSHYTKSNGHLERNIYYLLRDLNQNNFKREIINYFLEGYKSIELSEKYITKIRNEFLHLVRLRKPNKKHIDIIDSISVLQLKIIEKFNLDIPRELFSKNITDKIELFKLINLIVSDRNYFKTDIEYFIFNNREEFKNVAKSYSDFEVANKFDRTRERIRQIRNKLILNIHKDIQFISEFKTLFKSSIYPINTEDNIFIITPEYVKEINKNHDTEFSIDFVTNVLHIINSPKLRSLGYNFSYKTGFTHSAFIKNILPSNTRLNNRYLILDNNSDINSYYKFIQSIAERLSERITKDIHTNIEILIEKHFPIVSNLIKNICKQILESEWILKVESQNKSTGAPIEIKYNMLCFKRNTKKLNYEYIIEALEHFDKKTHKDDILSYIFNKYPHIKKTFSVQGQISRYKEYFIIFGRTSTYGLRQWEKEGLVKGGTIRNIVRDYLQQFNEPKPLNKIEAEVLKWRPKSNAYSIISNLKLMNETKSPFLFYKGTRLKKAHIGLKINRPMLKSKDFIELSLEDFLKEHKLM